MKTTESMAKTVNKVVRAHNKNIFDNFSNIIVDDCPMAVLYGNVEEAKEWAFTAADEHLHKNNIKMFGLTLRFPVLTFEFKKIDKNNLHYDLHLLTTFGKDKESSLPQINVRLNKYNVQSSESRKIRSCDVQTWSFVVGI